MDGRVIFVWIWIFCTNYAATNGSVPEQVHISFGDNPASMVVMWSSRDHIQYNVTYWKYPGNDMQSTRSDVIRLPKEAGKAVPYVYRAVLKGLTEGAMYFYKITPKNDQTLFSFSTLDKSKDGPYRFLVYGDMGSDFSMPTYTLLKSLVDSWNVTAVLHIGDFAYDLNDKLGHVGDVFFNNIQPIASRIPYMPSPGNHEIFDDFIHYRIRFSTPNTPWPIPINRLWYSYNIGPVHFVSYSTEVFFTYNQYYACEQFDWLLKDLTEANRNREKQPWIIAMGHRPMYCSNINIDDCTNRLTGRWVAYGLEDLFYAQGVDLILQAHEHSYERLWPMYKGKIDRKNYSNPRAPVHINSGAAGGPEGFNRMTPGVKSDWSAFKAGSSSKYSIGQLEIHNSTHLYFQQKQTMSSERLDGVWLIQNNHGPFVENLTCEGNNPHFSCFCPEPILYMEYVVGAGVILVILILLLVYIAYRCLYKNRQSSKYIRENTLEYTKLL